MLPYVLTSREMEGNHVKKYFRSIRIKRFIKFFYQSDCYVLFSYRLFQLYVLVERLKRRILYLYIKAFIHINRKSCLYLQYM